MARTDQAGRVTNLEWLVMLSISSALLGAAWWNWWPITVGETIGFVTGFICVWLVVRQHPANWPVGLANNAVFAWLFWQSGLYADMGLQFVYAIIAVYGWWNWTQGHLPGTSLLITRTRLWEWGLLIGVVPLFVWLLTWILVSIQGSAPFWDALTTTISLAAQYLLSKKRFENWWLWIAVDIIYIPLYLSRDLPLTAALYSVFLVMCCIGLREWSKLPNDSPVLTSAGP